MMSCERSSWVSVFGSERRPSAGRGERGQDVVVEEVGERPVAHVVEEAGHAQRLDDETLGWAVAGPGRWRPARPTSDG